MSGKSSSSLRRYLVFVFWVLAVCGVVLLIGYRPTRSLGGDQAVAAMLAGCAVSLAASVLGGIPIALAPVDGKSGLQATLVSTVLRFIVVMVLALAAALSGFFESAPLLIWVVISYVACLVVDTRFALVASRDI